jgi:hypothetical protein
MMAADYSPRFYSVQCLFPQIRSWNVFPVSGMDYNFDYHAIVLLVEIEKGGNGYLFANANTEGIS